MKILAKHEDYQITFHERPEDTGGPLVITFGGQDSRLTPTGFGTGWCQRWGWDTIYVAQRAATQYQHLSVQVFFDAVAEICKGRDVVCYGSSLGGYCAFYFGGVLDARIVTAAPMLPAWPPLGRLGDQMQLQHVPLADVPRSSLAPIIIYDPIVAHDQMMIDQMIMPTYPDVRLVPVEFGGHEVLETLKRAGLLSPVIEAMIGRDEILPLEFDGYSNPLWLFRRGRHFIKSDPEQARDLLERSLSLEPSKHVIGNLLSLLIRVGDLPAAQALLDQVRGSADPKMQVPPGILERARMAGLRE